MEQSKDYSEKVLKKIDTDLQDSDEAILKIKEHTKVTAERTGKTLEYGKSRWDYEKKRALDNNRYHFDWSKKDKIEDVLMFHGNVNMDCDYFIKTYSNEGDTILDMTCCSDYVGLRCSALERHYIGVDLEEIKSDV